MGVVGKDFTQNGMSLNDDFQAMMVSFNGSSDNSYGYSYELSKSSLNSQRSRVQSHSKKYADVLSFDISVIKKTLKPFNYNQKRNMIRWMTSPKSYSPLVVYDQHDRKLHTDLDDNVVTYDCVCVGVDEERPSPFMPIGLTFHFECNAPYGYIEKSVDFTSTSDSTAKTVSFQVVTDDMDDYIYPKLQIHPTATGTISIKNTSIPNTRTFTISVNSGDDLTIDANLGTITDVAGTFSYDSDTNLHWPKLENYVNDLSITGKCTGTITWREPRKIGI